MKWPKTLQSALQIFEQRLEDIAINRQDLRAKISSWLKQNGDFALEIAARLQ